MPSISLDQGFSDRRFAWIHRWATILSAMTFPLIWVGGLVTTYDAGMAVPDWPGTFGYNLWLYPWTTWIFGPFDLFVEHGHRLLGTVVGFLAILLLVSAIWWEPRRWVIIWCVVVLLAVIAQGVLGGLRVLMDERSMAMVHGCTGPVFFAMASATAVITSNWWRNSFNIKPNVARSGWPIMAVVLVGAAICQLVIGAQLRHIQPWAKPSTFQIWVHAHLTLATVVTLLVLALVWKVWFGRFRKLERIQGPSALLAILIVIQVSLGLGSWVANYAVPWPEWFPFLANYTLQGKGFLESWIVTGHQATGSLIIAVATVLALRLYRQLSSIV